MDSEKILKSLEFSQEVKDAVQRGIDRVKKNNLI